MNHNNNSSAVSDAHPAVDGQKRQAAPEVLEARDMDFVGSVPDQETVYPIDPVINSEILTDPVKQLSIASFLSRPQDIHSGTISAIATPNRLFTSDCLRTVARVPVWLDKLKGVYSFTATTVVRVVINAPPTFAGRLCVTFDPNNTLADYDVIYRSTSTIHYTQRHNVQLDFQDKSCVLKIPYCSPYNSYNLVEATGDVGTFSIYLMSPSRANVDTALVHYTVYLSYEDVKLGPPTLRPINVVPSGLVYSGDVVELQSIFSRITKAVKDPRALMEGTGVKFSTIAYAASNVAGALSGIPTLAPVSVPVSMVSRFFGSMLQHYGYSKIADTANFKSVWDNPLRFWYTSNGGDFSVPLGYDVDNQVPVNTAVTNTDLDEMSISYLCSIPVLSDSFVFEKLDTRGELLASGFVTPYNIDGTGFRNAYILSSSPLVISTTPMGVLNRTHFLWRGDLCYKLSSVKTKFHTGRLLVTWDPSGNSLTPVPSYDDAQAYTYKMLWDLSETNEITFKVPFYQTIAWCSRSPETSNYPSNNGVVRVWVVNPLLGTDNVSNQIDILTSCWMENASFAVPTNAGAPFLEPALQFQSIWSTNATPETYIGGSSPVEYAADALTVGECNLTIKNYMLTPQLYYSQTVADNSLSQIPVNCTVYANSASYTIPAGADGFTPNIHDLFRSAYCYQRGGYRTNLHHYGALKGYSPLQVSLGNRFFSSSITSATFSEPLTLMRAVPTRTVFADEQLPVRTPMYAPILGYDRKLSIYPSGSIISSTLVNGLRTPTLLVAKLFEPDPTYLDIYRAGGDDYRLHMFRGFYQVAEGF